jgi:hypothetical protein
MSRGSLGKAIKAYERSLERAAAEKLQQIFRENFTYPNI